MIELNGMVKRNCLVFLKDKGAVFFSLMAMIIVLVLTGIFLGDMNIESVTDLLEQGLSPEGLLEQILGEFGLEITEKIPVGYRCDCSRERVTKALISIGAAELQEMAEEGKPIEVNCQFCDKHYVFTPEELKDLLESAGNKA